MASPLQGLKTSRIVTSLQQLGYIGQFMTGVRPLTPANAFVGRARTLRLLPTRPDVVKAMQAEADADLDARWRRYERVRDRQGREATKYTCYCLEECDLLGP